MADMALPLSTPRQCVIPYHSRHYRDWFVPTTFDSQEVRISICNAVTAHMFLPLSTIRKCNMFLPPSFGGCVFPFHVLHHHSWHVLATINSQRVRVSNSRAAPSWLTCFCHFWLSGSAYFHSISSTIMADMFLPLLTLRKCVFPFHEQHNCGWHVPTTFDSQRVRISNPWAAPSWLTCSRHY